MSVRARHQHSATASRCGADALEERNPLEAMEMLLQKMKKTRVNGEFLLTIG